MNTFKRKALSAAVLAGLGAAGSAEAVYLSPNNTGQVLVYPYYTVQSSGTNAWNTYVSVVNTTSRSKAVKVRFLEGKTSAEVLDFNLYLSPNDVWTAAITPTGAGGAGHLVTSDASCTEPVIPAGGVDFRNFQFSSPSSSSGWGLPGNGLDRTREGYIEMLEMGTITLGSPTDLAITHVSGVPPNCGYVQPYSAAKAAADIVAPTGGLMGTGTLINTASGQDVGYKADALDAWRNSSFWSSAGSLFPDITFASPAVSLVLNSGGPSNPMGATAYLTDFGVASAPATVGSGISVGAGGLAVASVFMNQAVLNEYVLDAATQSNTDWVITQPLKRFFVNNTGAVAPYTNTLTSSGACETISFTYFNREEQTAAASPGDFSPPPPSAPANTLCWESTVVSINNGSSWQPTSAATGVLASENNRFISLGAGFQDGWANLTFIGTDALQGNGIGLPMAGAIAANRVSLNSTTPAAPVVTAGTYTFFGLPVTGFAVANFKNNANACTTASGAAASCQSGYAELFKHSYIRAIAP